MSEWESPTGDGEGGEGAPGGLDAQQIIDASALELERNKEILRLKIQINEQMGQELEAAKEKIKLEQKNLDVLAEEAKKYDEISNARKKADFRAQMEKQIQAMKKLGTLSESSYKKMSEILKKQTLSAKEIQAELKKIKGEMDDVSSYHKTINEGWSALGGTIGLVFDVSQTKVGKMSKAINQLINNTDTWKQKLKNVGSGFNQLTSITNVAASVFQMIWKTFESVEKGAISMSKVTLKSKSDMMDALTEVEDKYRRFGVMPDELGAAFSRATTSLRGFNLMTAKQGFEIAGNIKKLEQFGASANTSMSLINKLSIGNRKSLGATTKDVVNLAMTVKHMGIDSEMALKDFEGALKMLSSSGQEAMEEFLGLAHQAKITGAAMQDLLAVAGKFDTFKDSANFVAMLNGTLGTNLSSMELMQMDMNERVKTIRESISATVGDFGQLDRATQLMIANQIAGGDLMKAKMMLGAATAEETAQYEEAQEKMQMQAEAMEKLAEIGPQLLTFMQQMANEFYAAIAGTEGFKETIIALKDGMLFAIDVIKALGNNIKLITTIWIGYRTALAAYNITSMLSSRRTFLLMTKNQHAAMANTNLTLTEYRKQQAMAMGVPVSYSAASGMTAFGTALRFAAGPLLMIIMLLMDYFTTTHMEGSPQLWAIAGVMALGVIALGAAFYFAGPAIIPVIGSLALLMGAMALIFHALPPLVEALERLFETIANSSLGLFEAAGGMMALGGAFIFLGSSAAVASLGIAMGTLAMVGLRATMFMTGTSFSDMLKAGEGIHKIGEGMKNFDSGLKGMVANASQLKEALGDTTLVASVRADTTSIMAGKDALFASLAGGNTRITVDVKMPEEERNQQHIVNVYLDGEMIDSRIHDTVNGAQG